MFKHFSYANDSADNTCILKKGFEKAHLKKRFFRHKIKPFKCVNRLKGTLMWSELELEPKICIFRLFLSSWNFFVGQDGMRCRNTACVEGAGELSMPQAPLTPSNWSALYRGRGSPVMSWILLKANNAQQSSGGCARFNVRLKSDLVLIFNFNSTNK